MSIAPYNPVYEIHFQKIEQILADNLTGICLAIEHVGSTAVPKLAAKPIIDIDIIYNEAIDFEKIKKALGKLGYYHNGHQSIVGREVFKRTAQQNDAVLDQITHHLYVCRYDCYELHRHLIFRDYLLKNEEARNYYQQLKYEMAEEAKQDKKLYANIKELKANSFINYIITLSKAENRYFTKVKCI